MHPTHTLTLALSPAQSAGPSAIVSLVWRLAGVLSGVPSFGCSLLSASNSIGRETAVTDSPIPPCRTARTCPKSCPIWHVAGRPSFSQIKQHCPGPPVPYSGRYPGAATPAPRRVLGGIVSSSLRALAPEDICFLLSSFHITRPQSTSCNDQALILTPRRGDTRKTSYHHITTIVSADRWLGLL